MSPKVVTPGRATIEHLLMRKKGRRQLVECKQVAEGKESVRRAACRIQLSYRQPRRV